MKSLFKKLFFRLLTLSGGIIVAFIIAEIAVRILGVEDTAQEVHLNYNAAGYVPGADPVGPGHRFKMSSNRKLVYEPSSPPVLPPCRSPDELRILCLGDSVVDNVWRRSLLTFPALLSEKISKNLIPPWKSCTVINAGVTGYNPVQEFEWYKNQWRDGQFNIVIVCYCCANDRGENRQIVRGSDGDFLCYHVREYFPYFLDFPGQQWLLKSSNLYRLINSRLAPYVEKWGGRVKEIDLDRVPVIKQSLLGLRELCERNGSRFLVLIMPRLRPEEREYRWIMNLVQAADIDYLDLRPPFEELGYDAIVSRNNDGSIDTVHPNQRGHEIISDLIIRRLWQWAGETPTASFSD